jgi:putative spermidine/putrescine transport system ATP-binding protein
MPELALEHVTKLYGDAPAVDDLSLKVGNGEFVCLLGPSGCGKTTTLRMIAGFETVDRGAILLDGEDVTAVPPQKRDIGFVFQHYALFPHMTVAQNVGYGLKLRRYTAPRIAEEVGAALGLVRLGHLSARYPSQLSGGEQQRVALARALAIRPRLLLMDEPLSNLDAKLRDAMRIEIRRIQRQVGITTIFVTHDQAEAFALADRIGVMMQGKLRQLADPVSLYEKPESALVGSFIGQVNVLSGQLRACEQERARVAVADGLEIVGVGRDLRPGTAVTALVKQERVLLSRERPGAGGAGDAAENVFSCRIEARTFLGGNIFYMCRLLGLPGAAVNALVPSHPSVERFEPGDTVFARWSAADCHVFAA